MRILYLSDVYFPRVNGVSTSIQTFRRDLEALGHEVIVVAPDYGQQSAINDHVIRIPARRVPLDPEDRLMQSAALRRLPDRPELCDIDLVHIQTPFAAHYAGLRIARALKVPVVATYHTFFEEYLYHYAPFAPRAWMRAFARTFSRRQGNQVDALVVPSRAMHAALTAYGVRTPLTILPTGIRMQELTGGNGAAFRRQHGIAPERPVLVHVGRVAFEKNIDFLLRMLLQVRARHPDVLLLIAGEGPALPHLRSLTRSLLLEDNVKFIGYLDRAGPLLDCYCAGDLFVFASRTETQGLVLLEAMALGVPVVALAEMGTVDILEPQRGSVIARHDETDFAERVNALLGSATLRRGLAAQAVKFAAQWDATAQAQKLAQLYAAVIHSGRNDYIDSAVGTHRNLERRGTGNA
ncbi:MAG: glycosyltransferase family 4 protein [Betaproteobacteria bacterium]|nr:glycosyltransferase family 4 protein [Betaproteobacteria bacterium]